MSTTLSINCGGTLLSLDKPRVMGILNVTPDSFYDGGKYTSDRAIMNQVERMLSEGADLIDVGGMSSRPGAVLIDEELEVKRVIPVVRSILTHFPNTLISVDTVRSSVAREAAAAGAVMINDISAGKFDAKMCSTVAELQLPYVLMHMKGSPEDMQHNPEYSQVTVEVLDFFIQKLGELRALGVKDVILDPGFGFGKTVAHNYQLLTNLSAFSMLDCPVLAGLSRKSMICKVLEVNPSKALNGTTALHMVALQNGARLLRVHDVKEARETISLFETCLVHNPHPCC
ncbi:MAG: dihydropteroate synthase [Saprospiraceae bacterium]